MTTRKYLALCSKIFGESPYERRRAPEPEIVTALVSIIPKDLLVKFKFSEILFINKRRLSLASSLVEYFPQDQLQDLLSRLFSIRPEIAKYIPERTLELALKATDEISEHNFRENRRVMALTYLAARFSGVQQKQILEKALKASVELENDEAKLSALARIASMYSELTRNPLSMKALALAQSFEPEYRAAALSKVVPLIEDESLKLKILKELLSLLPKDNFEEEHAEILAELAKHFPKNAGREGLLKSALEIAEAMIDPMNKCFALAALVPLLESPIEEEKFELLLTAIESALVAIPNSLLDTEIRNAEDFLEKLEPELNFEGPKKARILEKILLGVKNFTQEETRALILTDLVPHFTPEMILEAFSQAQTFKENWWRLKVLSHLYPYLPVDAQEAYADQVFSISNERILSQIEELQEKEKAQLFAEVVQKFLDDYGGMRKKGLGPESSDKHVKPHIPVLDEESIKLPSPQERIINTGFSAVSAAEIELDKNTPLIPNMNYYFTFDVGLLREGNIEVTPEPLRMELLPEQARLKIVLFKFDGEIEITPNRDVGELQIMRDWKVKVTKKVETPNLPPSQVDLIDQRLFFLIHTPTKEGEFRLRCNMYCEQTLVQSRLIKVKVSYTNTRSDAPMLSSTIEYTITKSLDPKLIAQLEPQKLSIMLNDNGDGTHCFRLFGESNYKYEKSFGVGTLQNLIKNARAALRITYWGSEKDWQSDQSLKYQGPLDLKKLKEDLVLLAKQGAEFWLKLTQKVAPGGDYSKLSSMVEKPAVIEFAIKDSSEAANYMFPTALIYDYPILTNFDVEEYSLCPIFQEALNKKMPLEETRCFKGDCPTKSSTALKEICPSGFWGFRHIVGMPLGTTTESSQEIFFQEAPEITAAVFPSFATWPPHQKAIQAIDINFKWTIAKSFMETLSQLRSTNPHLVYFYCHGGYEKDTPYLRVGSANEHVITPTNFSAFNIRWKQTQPIVFMNGCHTVGIDPRLVLDFASTFVVSLNASGVMGTEISIFESLAAAFAEQWLTSFLLKGETAGESTRRARLNLLQKGNPLGLVYSLYAHPHLKLKKQMNNANPP
jgi:hypothetical protein